jgi:hypothetical protein
VASTVASLTSVVDGSFSVTLSGSVEDILILVKGRRSECLGDRGTGRQQQYIAGSMELDVVNGLDSRAYQAEGTEVRAPDKASD